MFILLTIVFIMIGITAWFGDYEEKEIKRDYEKYKEMFYK